MTFHWAAPGQLQIMGILNTTPDSFSDGGRYFGAGAGVDAVHQRIDTLLKEGADLLDIGGESTRPGAGPVSAQEELDRVLPAIEYALACQAVVSVDTSKPAVMRAALKAGAQVVNDVRALQEMGALAAVAESGAAVCLMHMQGEPRQMQADPRYQEVLAEVRDFLAERVRACEVGGIKRERIAIDPGFGFGKTFKHNLALLARLPEFATLGLPLLAGLSRKSMIGQLTGAGVDERLPGSLALALLAVQGGARIVRVHDVGATRQALQIWQAVQQEKGVASE